MREPTINRVSWIVLICLSIVALLAVLTGYTKPPQRDEGAGAHIFQLSVVLLLPVGLLFLVTADWGRSLRSVRPLAVPAVPLLVAFGALYYLENYFFR